MTTLVTGATGFIGSRLITTLVHKGEKVRCLVRPGSDTFTLRKLGVEIFYGDINDPKSLYGIARNVDCVYHLAGTAFAKRCHDFFKINYQGTINLVNECLQSNLNKFIFLSSVAVNGYNDRNTLQSEHSQYQPIGPYGISKLKAEHFLMDKFIKYNFPVVIIRAPIVYGPSSNMNIINLILRACSRGRIFLIGNATNKRSICYIDNLVHGLLIARNMCDLGGHVYHIADDHAFTVKEILRQISNYLRTEVKIIYLPEYIGKISKLAFDCLAKIGIYALVPFILWNMTLTITVSIEKAKKELNYQPIVSTDDGIKATVQHFLHHFTV